jgi:hypothetical protein
MKFSINSNRPADALPLYSMRSRRGLGRILIATLAALLLFYGLASAALYAAMKQPPETFGAIMSHVPLIAMIALPFEPLWMSARAGNLAAGQAAPDIELPLLDRSGTVKLSAAYRNKPVALIFGSYT